MKIAGWLFFLDGLSASEKAAFTMKCLEFVDSSGVIVTSLTFDGNPANFSMARILGADFQDPQNLKIFFPHQ